MKIWLKILFCAIFFMTAKISFAGRSADYQDVYMMGWLGWRNGGGMQFGGGVGYVFTEGFGIGAVYEQNKSMPFAAAELRWFLEPFESAFGFGVENRQVNSKSDFMPMATLCGDYLFSITPSFALRASIKWLLPLEERSGVFTGMGGRLLF